MFCVSLSHHNSDISLRESVPFGPEILSSLEQGVFLSTCNRVEVYGEGDLYAFVERYFSELKPHLFLYEGKKAIRHLYRVTAGLDSMVVGEDEILGQVKRAFAEAQENGHTGYELNTIFRGAITTAKKIKTDTLLSKSSVSTATLAAAACVHYWNEQGLDRKGRILVIGGSGEIGRTVLKDLVSYDRFDITATVREHSVRDDVRVADYRDRYDVMKDADIVVSATRYPKFTVTKEELTAADGGTAKPRLFVDLAVPRDIDPELSPIITIDDLAELAKHNNEVRLDAAHEAEQILNEELDTLYKDLLFHRMLSAKNFSTLFATEDRKHFLYSFRDNATADEFESFANAIVRRSL